MWVGRVHVHVYYGLEVGSGFKVKKTVTQKLGYNSGQSPICLWSGVSDNVRSWAASTTAKHLNTCS